MKIKFIKQINKNYLKIKIKGIKIKKLIFVKIMTKNQIKMICNINLKFRSQIKLV